MTLITSFNMVALMLVFSACIQVTVAAHESVFTLPRIFSLDTTSPQVLRTLININGREYIHPDITGCIIKVHLYSNQNTPLLYFTVFCWEHHQALQPHPQQFPTQINITNPDLENEFMLECMVSQTFTNDGLSFHVDELQGTPYGCPKGVTLLKVHEEIGIHLGATFSKLCDASTL